MKTFHKDTTTAALKSRIVLSKDAINKKKQEKGNTRQHLFCPEVLYQRLGCGIALYLDIDSHTCKDVYNKIGAINKVQVELATVLPHQQVLHVDSYFIFDPYIMMVKVMITKAQHVDFYIIVELYIIEMFCLLLRLFVFFKARTEYSLRSLYTMAIEGQSSKFRVKIKDHIEFLPDNGLHYKSAKAKVILNFRTKNLLAPCQLSKKI